jgi:hypothetical protein
LYQIHTDLRPGIDTTFQELVDRFKATTDQHENWQGSDGDQVSQNAMAPAKLQHEIDSLYQLLNPSAKDRMISDSRTNSNKTSQLVQRISSTGRKGRLRDAIKSMPAVSASNIPPDSIRKNYSSKGRSVRFDVDPELLLEHQEPHAWNTPRSKTSRGRVSVSAWRSRSPSAFRYQNNKLHLPTLRQLEARSEKRIVLRVSSGAVAFGSTDATDTTQDQAGVAEEPPACFDKMCKTDNANESTPLFIEALSADFANLQLSTKRLSAEVANKFLTLLPSYWLSDPNRMLQLIDEFHHEDLELSQPLSLVISLLALLECLPDWTVYTTTSDQFAARTALTLVYCSLLEHVLNHAVDLSSIIEQSIDEMVKRPKDTKELQLVMQIFHTSIQRLANLDFSPDDLVVPFQPDLKMALRKLESQYADISCRGVVTAHMQEELKD